MTANFRSSAEASFDVVTNTPTPTHAPNRNVRVVRDKFIRALIGLRLPSSWLPKRSIRVGLLLSHLTAIRTRPAPWLRALSLGRRWAFVASPRRGAKPVRQKIHHRRVGTKPRTAVAYITASHQTVSALGTTSPSTAPARVETSSRRQSYRSGQVSVNYRRVDSATRSPRRNYRIRRHLRTWGESFRGRVWGARTVY